VRLTPGLWAETVGEDVLVLDADRAVVHHLSGASAEAVRAVVAGHAPRSLPDDVRFALRTLVDSGLVTSEARLTRRGLLRTGGALAGVGLATIALPTAAAATSHEGDQNITAFKSLVYPGMANAANTGFLWVKGQDGLSPYKGRWRAGSSGAFTAFPVETFTDQDTVLITGRSAGLHQLEVRDKTVGLSDDQITFNRSATLVLSAQTSVSALGQNPNTTGTFTDGTRTGDWYRFDGEGESAQPRISIEPNYNWGRMTVTFTPPGGATVSYTETRSSGVTPTKMVWNIPALVAVTFTTRYYTGTGQSQADGPGGNILAI
jgi:hypothetical protein